ncbi:MAG: energy transducer TonB, partial [Opitutales bacterium]|nr:energy transducer TonB [Opitutales bacterium]
KPRPLMQVQPTYPSSLKKSKISGTVFLVFVVDEAGNVLDPQVEKSTHKEFSASALSCIKRWKFQPGYVDAEPVKVRVRAPMIFKVN